MTSPDPSRYRLRRYPNGVWRICWTEARVTRSRSTGATTQAEAAIFLARWLEAAANDNAPEPTVDDVLAYHLDEAAGRSVGLHRLQHAGKALARHLGSRVAATLRPVDSRTYAKTRTEEGVGPGTIGYELRILRAALRLAFDDGLLRHLPAIKPPVRPDPKDRWITPEEASRLVAAAAATPHLRLFLVIAICTGARAGAILGLTWDRVDFEGGVIDFHDPALATTKKHRATVPMNETLELELLQARRELGPDAGGHHVVEHRGRPIRDIRTAFGRAVAGAGLEPLTPHALRHSVATWLSDLDAPVQKIAQILGHADDRTTQRVYIKRRASALRSVVALLG